LIFSAGCPGGRVHVVRDDGLDAVICQSCRWFMAMKATGQLNMGVEGA